MKTEISKVADDVLSNIRVAAEEYECRCGSLSPWRCCCIEEREEHEAETIFDVRYLVRLGIALLDEEEGA